MYHQKIRMKYLKNIVIAYHQLVQVNVLLLNCCNMHIFINFNHWLWPNFGGVNLLNQK